MSPIHIIGNKGFVLRDPRVDDSPDDDIAPILREIEAAVRDKLPAAKFMIMVEMPNKRSHYLAGDAEGPLRRDEGVKMATRLRHLFTTGR